MAALRKASAYSKKEVRPYTRKSAKRRKAFIKTVPQNKIVKYNMGKKPISQVGNHKYVVRMIAAEKVQIRDNSLESCRMTINKTMEKFASGRFYFIVKVFPHHIIRENKIAAGAGADRLSSGMRHSFGITMGRSAIVPNGREIFTVYCADEKVAQIAKAAMIKTKPKVACKNKIVFESVKDPSALTPGGARGPLQGSSQDGKEIAVAA